MKSLPFLLGLLLATIVSFTNFISFGIAAEVVFAWEANDEADLAGYALYKSNDSSGSPYDLIDDIFLNELADTDNPEVTVTQLEDGKKYYFVVTAFDKANNESNFSDEICLKVEGASIVDCASKSSLVSGSNSSGGGGGCLISAAAYGFRMSKEILKLALLFVSMLIVFHKIREKLKN